MSVAELGNETHQLVDNLPEDVLSEAYRYLQALSSDDFIPKLGCTRAEYNREIDESLAEIERGEVVEHEDVINMLKQIIDQKK